MFNFNLDNLKKYCTNRVINIIVVSAFLLFVLIIIFAASIGSNSPSIIASTNSVLSTKKIGWGIKRGDNHEQPDLGAENKKIIDEFDGYALGNKDKPYIYLTFDVGYDNGYTSKILDVLKQNKVCALFFVTGQFVNTSPDLLQRMIDEGHIVGNHIPFTLMTLIKKM